MQAKYYEWNRDIDGVNCFKKETISDEDIDKLFNVLQVWTDELIVAVERINCFDADETTLIFFQTVNGNIVEANISRRHNPRYYELKAITGGVE